MDRPVRVSVALASYNGARYIEEQVRSILAELGDDDEIVVVDDASTDDTVDVLRSIGDPRIRLFPRSENRGYVRTFEEALGCTRGEYILLSDQDDVWIPGRVGRLLKELQHRLIAASNLEFLDSGDRPGWSFKASATGRWRRNLLIILSGTSGYYGCGMAMRRRALQLVTPFPPYLTESHDLWLAIAGNLAHSIGHVEEPTLRRRVHGDNATPDRPRSVPAILRARVMLLRSIVTLRRRLRLLNRSVAAAATAPASSSPAKP
jgi:glycosyltransferase involved in cell wall biosynthesis